MLKERIDKLLVDKGLVESRQKAQALILAGQILVNNQRIDKAGQKVDIQAELRIKGEQLRYVSRAGLKLAAALETFKISPQDQYCLDIGASTGGFTDCLLQFGAVHVVALDVGHSQLDWRIRQHLAVEVREGINARYLKPTDFAYQFGIVTMDVSFISLTKILPAVPALLQPAAHIVTLIKPQFEVGRGEVGKGGIVTEPGQHLKVLEEVIGFAQQELSLVVLGVMASPITGTDGNREFLAHFTNDQQRESLDWRQRANQLTILSI